VGLEAVVLEADGSGFGIELDLAVGWEVEVEPTSLSLSTAMGPDVPGPCNSCRFYIDFRGPILLHAIPKPKRKESHAKISSAGTYQRAPSRVDLVEQRTVLTA
jgi:hypothetical protein